MFWAHIEAEVIRTLQSQSPLPPQNSPFNRVVIPLSPNLAIVSPTTCLLLALQLEIPPLPPRTESELNIAVAQGSLTAFLSLESSFINLPFRGKEENIFLIQILHWVPCFKMTIRCHRHKYPTPRTFQLLLNPLLRNS